MKRLWRTLIGERSLLQWAFAYFVGAILFVSGLIVYVTFLAPDDSAYQPVTHASLDVVQVNTDTHQLVFEIEACVNEPILALTFSSWLNVDTGEVVAGAASASENPGEGCTGPTEGQLTIPRPVEAMGGTWRLAIFSFVREIEGEKATTVTVTTEDFNVPAVPDDEATDDSRGRGETGG